MAEITPRALVHKALSRRYISNNPVLPQPVNTNVPRENLYNFSEVGGMAPAPTDRLHPNQTVREKYADTAPPSDAQAAGFPQSQTPGVERASAVQPMPQPSVPADTPAASSTPTATASTSVEEELRKLMEERAKVDGTEIVDDDSKLMNFWKGSQFAVRQVQRQGGDLGSTLGALVGGGLRGLFTKTEDETREKEEKLGKLDKKIAVGEKRRDAELERKAKELTNQKKQLENTIDFRKLVADPIWDLATKMKELTPAMADALEKAGYPKLPPAKWQEIKDQWVNGTLMQRPEFGTTFTPNTSAGTKPNEQITNFDTGAGAFPVTNEQAARMGSDITAANIAAQNRTNIENVNNEIQVAIKNAELTNQYNTADLARRVDAIKAAATTVQDAGKLQGIATEMQAVASQMAEFEKQLASEDPKIKAEAQKSFDKANSQYGELQNKFDTQVGQTQGGAAVSQYLNSLPALPKPKLITATKIDPVLNKGKAVPKSKDPLGIFQ